MLPKTLCMGPDSSDPGWRCSPWVRQDPAVAHYSEYWEERWRKDAVRYQEEALHGNLMSQNDHWSPATVQLSVQKAV